MFCLTAFPLSVVILFPFCTPESHNVLVGNSCSRVITDTFINLYSFRLFKRVVFTVFNNFDVNRKIRIKIVAVAAESLVFVVNIEVFAVFNQIRRFAAIPLPALPDNAVCPGVVNKQFSFVYSAKMPSAFCNFRDSVCDFLF